MNIPARYHDTDIFASTLDSLVEMFSDKLLEHGERAALSDWRCGVLRIGDGGGVAKNRTVDVIYFLGSTWRGHD